MGFACFLPRPAFRLPRSGQGEERLPSLRGGAVRAQDALLAERTISKMAPGARGPRSISREFRIVGGCCCRGNSGAQGPGLKRPQLGPGGGGRRAAGGGGSAFLKPAFLFLPLPAAQPRGTTPWRSAPTSWTWWSWASKPWSSRPWAWAAPWTPTSLLCSSSSWCWSTAWSTAWKVGLCGRALRGGPQWHWLRCARPCPLWAVWCSAGCPSALWLFVLSAVRLWEMQVCGCGWEAVGSHHELLCVLPVAKKTFIGQNKSFFGPLELVEKLCPEASDIATSVKNLPELK